MKQSLTTAASYGPRAALLAAAVFHACAESEPEAPPTPEQPRTPPVVAPPDTGRVEIPLGSVANFDIIDDAFVDEEGDHNEEANASVKVGQMVTWTQNGNKIHRVEFSAVPNTVEHADSRDLRPGRTWEYRPPLPGKYVFFCRYHEYMMDVVIEVVEEDS